jgi:polysaccharide biosynthesis/export protein PslD
MVIGRSATLDGRRHGWRGRAFAAAMLALGLAGCGTNAIRAPERVETSSFAPWVSEDEPYRIGPGDELEIRLPYAGEYNDRAVVGPDGRFTLPLVGEVIGEGKTVTALTEELERRFSRDLIQPRVSVAIRNYASQRVFVGGEVNAPGLVNLPGRIGVMEAILLAKGFMDTAKTSEVVLIRRGRDGKPMLRTVDIVAYVGGRTPDVPLQAFDVIFVPKSSIAEVNLFIDQFINRVVPFQRGFTYTVGRTTAN